MRDICENARRGEGLSEPARKAARHPEEFPGVRIFIIYKIRWYRERFALCMIPCKGCFFISLQETMRDRKRGTAGNCIYSITGGCHEKRISKDV